MTRLVAPGAGARRTPPQPVTLEGRYVRLVPLSLAHVGALVEAARGGRETFAYTVVPSEEESMARYVAEALHEQEAGRAVPFATVDHMTRRIVGSTRFGSIA